MFWFPFCSFEHYDSAFSEVCCNFWCSFLGEVKQLEIALARSKASEEEIKSKYREAKINALEDHARSMKSDIER